MDNVQMDLQDKMSQAHRDNYKRMLGLNELPLPLLKRYFLLKKLYDKIDGFLSVGDMVRIALDVGFNPETMRFDITTPMMTITTQGGAETHVEDVTHEEIIAAAARGLEVARDSEPEPQVADGVPEKYLDDIRKPGEGAGLIPEGTVIDSETKEVIAKPGEEMETATNVVEDAPAEEVTLEQATEAAEEAEKPVEEEKPEPEPEKEDPDDIDIIPIGTPVVVLFKEGGESGYYNGKVNDNRKKDDDGEIVYSIETEEDILEVPRENIEVS